ncbi:MAG TPA: GH3 auxin-responsive promoter family protein, partial [Allocoleopsis sp.]
LCRYLEQYSDELIYDLAAGTIAPWLKLEPEQRTQLERMRRPMPDRAAQLRQVFQAEGRLTPITAWKNLAFVGTARGGTSDFYFEQFPDYFADTPVFGGVFGTAEGTFSIYPDLNRDGGVLALESGFYEFIPQDQWDVEQPKTLLPTEVKVGGLYRLLVTSYSGFYRYDIGDVVEVVDFYEQTPMIVFRYRRGGLLSSTTEKTTEFHATQAMHALQQEFGIALDDFCITLSEQEFPAHYLVNIELATGQTLSDPEAFLARFDDWLGEFNNPYATVRKDQVPPPRLRILAPGSFAIVRQRQLLRGTSDSQLKIPHVTEDRRFLDGLEVVQEFRLPTDVPVAVMG